MNARLVGCLVWACAGCAAPATDGNRGPAASLEVAGEPVDLGLVGRVAASAQVGPREAFELVVSDLRVASVLRERDPALASYLRRLTLARALSERIVARARAAGPPTEEELQEFTARHWAELDRPALSRVTHLLVRVPDGGDRDRGRALAEALRPRLVAAPTSDGFRDVASKSEGQGFELKVEELLPVAADGRAVDPNALPPPGARTSRYVAEFARAAAGIAEVGQVSEVVESKFGFHVLLLTERFPELRPSAEERRRVLAPEIESTRARREETALLARLRAENSVDVDVGALGWTEGLSSAP